MVLIALVAGLLNYFGNRAEHAWYLSLIAFISWFFPFSIVVLVPLDLASTLWRGCTDEEQCKEPFMYVSSEFLVAAWRTIYWCSFALTWVMIPLLQAYTQSGEFTVMKRFRHAVRYNIIYQLIVGSIAMLGLVYVWYSQGPSNLRAYVMALSNSWGLILVVIFMGYGMVDVPRRLWHKGDNARELRRLAFKASVVKDKCQDTEDEVLSVAKELSVVCHKVQLSGPLRPYVDKMVEDFPAVRGVQFESSRTASPIPFQRGDVTGTASGATSGVSRMPPAPGVLTRKQSLESVPAVITEKYLADLHARIKRALRMNDRWKAIWHDLLQAGFLAQDIQENMDNPEKKFRSNLRPLTVKPKGWQLSFEWVWHLKLRPIILRSLSVFLAVISLLIVWSEMTYRNTNPVLSVIGLLVDMARDRMSYGAIEAISFFTMLYMCTCAYTTLMKMRLLNNYVLVPNHHTDEPTLLFIGSYLCRLTFPLVYNYLTISSTSKDDTTEFSAYMGKIDMVPFLGEFNYYMPYLILAPTLITLFNVFAKMFAVCSISDNFFDNDDEEGGIGGDLEEGLQVLADARRDEERRLLPDRVGMNRDFTARRGAAFESYNNNKNRRRGDMATHSMLGEGSSASAWRDVRPYPSGSNQRPYQEPYFDDSSDDEDAGSVAGGIGGINVGGSTGLGAGTRSSVDSPGRLGTASTRGSHRNLSKLDPINHSNNNHTREPPVPSGAFKSMWQKLTRPKQAISLDNAPTPDLIESDDARSSMESNGHRQPPHSGRSFRPDRHIASNAATRTGPALMFASVQQQPSSYGRHSEDRERLLTVGGGGHQSPYSSRTNSPQGRPVAGAAGRNNPRNSRVFGTSHPAGNGGAGNQFRPLDSSSRSGPSSHRQASPLVNINDEDD
ncbi:hypothetical protein BGZ98_008411 [Dissophora globulifera]|nr:hypothetical protein BGZ98_008411 [Dissophora globulifera]